MRFVFSLIAIVLLAGCTSNPAVDLFTVESIPDTQTGASKTGTYPQITSVPRGETSRLTSAQTSAEKRSLVQAASKGRGQAAANNQAAYRREVARLRRLAREQRARRAAGLKTASQ